MAAAAAAAAANTNASSNKNKKKKGQRQTATGGGKHVAFSDGTRPGYAAPATGTRTPRPATITTLAPPRMAPTFTPKSSRLTRGQLNTTILFSVSVSRLILLFNSLSYREPEEEIVPSETCLHYLGATACQSEAVQALLRLKFASSIECAILVFAVLALSWSHEGHLQRLQAFLILSPLATTFFVLYYANLYHDAENDDAPVLVNGLFQECIMCVVLVALVAPYDDSIFIGTLNTTTHVPRQARIRSRLGPRRKTWQSLVLFTLCLFHWVEVVRQVGPLVQHAVDTSQTDATADASNTTTTTTTTTTTLTGTRSLLPYYFDRVSTGMPNDTVVFAAGALIVQFLLIDLLCRAIVYAYAWFAMEETYQRVRSLCVALLLWLWLDLSYNGLGIMLCSLTTVVPFIYLVLSVGALDCCWTSRLGIWLYHSHHTSLCERIVVVVVSAVLAFTSRSLGGKTNDSIDPGLFGRPGMDHSQYVLETTLAVIAVSCHTGEGKLDGQQYQPQQHHGTQY